MVGTGLVVSCAPSIHPKGGASGNSERKSDARGVIRSTRSETRDLDFIGFIPKDTALVDRKCRGSDGDLRTGCGL